MDHVISESCYKGTILQLGIIEKMTILFELMLYIPVNNFSVMSAQFPVFPG